MARICFSQPEAWSPSRKMEWDGTFNSSEPALRSHTAKEESQLLDRILLCYSHLSKHGSQRLLLNKSLTFHELAERTPHHVDVFDAEEVHLHAHVVLLRLVALARGAIGHGVQLQQYSACSQLSIIDQSWTRVDPLTRGRVSMIQTVRELGVALRMQASICSSSSQRALKPDKGCEHRQMAAYIQRKFSTALYIPHHYAKQKTENADNTRW